MSHNRPPCGTSASLRIATARSKTPLFCHGSIEASHACFGFVFHCRQKRSLGRLGFGLPSVPGQDRCVFLCANTGKTSQNDSPRNTPLANIKRKCYHAWVDEGRKRVLGIIACILVARHLKSADELLDNRSSPPTEAPSRRLGNGPRGSFED